MKQNIDDLLQEFNKITSKGFIESVTNSFGSVGLTFEKQLNKEHDSMYFPDYYGIEIKCTSRYSRYPMYLFTVAFDGPTFPEINRVVEKYGYYDKDFPNNKVLFENLNCVNRKTVNEKYRFKFDVDYEEEKLYLCVYNLNNELIERESFVYFSTIKNHLLLKMSTLALIYAISKNIDGKKHFKYYSINIYKLKNFNTFIDLLNKGIIEISLISRISKSGLKAGKYSNKNLVFYIKKRFIPMLFEKYY